MAIETAERLFSWDVNFTWNMRQIYAVGPSCEVRTHRATRSQVCFSRRTLNLRTRSIDGAEVVCHFIIDVI